MSKYAEFGSDIVVQRIRSEENVHHQAPSDFTLRRRISFYYSCQDNARLSYHFFKIWLVWSIFVIATPVHACFDGCEGSRHVVGKRTNETIQGSDGNDCISGKRGNDIIYGGPGDDSICGGLHDDVLEGGEDDDWLSGDQGDDTYVYLRGDGNDVIEDRHDNNRLVLRHISESETSHIRAGDDLIIVITAPCMETSEIRIVDYFRSGEVAIEFDNSARPCFESYPELNKAASTDCGDKILGTRLGDRLCGQGGNDIIRAWGEDDLVNGNTGSDIIFGNSGNDTINGNEGNDIVYGGKGDDDVHGGEDNDTLYGDLGNDSLSGGKGDDIIYGDKGRIPVKRRGGDDTYYYRAGDGADTIYDWGGLNTLVFLQIRERAVEYEEKGDDLVARIGLGDLSGSITIKNYNPTNWQFKYETQPNVILIFADDLGYGDLGIYGQKKIKTPVIDKMAMEGVRFTNFYANTFCPPSRNSLMTGKHPGNIQFINSKLGWALSAGAPILPQLLQENRYLTAMFGKWALTNFDGNQPISGQPHLMGFDIFTGFLTHRDAHVYYLDSPSSLIESTPERPYYNTVRQHLYTIADKQTVPYAIPQNRYTHDAFVEHALDFIAVNKHRQFFLFLPFTIPHAELTVPSESLDEYLDDDGLSIFPEEPWTPKLDGNRYDRHNPTPRATYAAMISRLDRDVGRILDRIVSVGLEKDTVIFFTSDNGPHNSGGIKRSIDENQFWNDDDVFQSSGRLRGLKFTLYEGGIRVPFIAWGPTVVKGGRIVNDPMAIWDLLPTIAEITDTPISEDIDGISMLPLLAGLPQPQHDYMYWARGNQVAVRKGDWKLVRNILSGDDEFELFNLEIDPGENDNVINLPANCDVLRELLDISNAHHPSIVNESDVVTCTP